MNENPKVLKVIPVRGWPDYLKEAAYIALNQTYINIVVIKRLDDVFKI